MSWTFTDGFSFQIEKMKEMAELWSYQRARTPNPKKKAKTSLPMQFTRRDSFVSHLYFIFQDKKILTVMYVYHIDSASENIDRI